MNQPTSKPIKYFIYARKSSESDEKQVQSIEDQIQVLDQFRKLNNLTVVDILTEARSAKEPGGRPVFEEMIRRLKKGEANGIIVWKIDRLSRNPIDGANIQWLLQKGILASIKTPDREYRPEDNVLILSVESSMATQYILDLSKNVKRGLKSKIDKGWRPNLAPIGYLNTKTQIRGENYIIKDPERFMLVRRVWDFMLTGNYLPMQILEIASNQWGLRSRQFKRKGGGPLTRNAIYSMLSNIFYAGIFEINGQYYQGKHDPMITLDEFDRVQRLLGRKGKPRPNKHEYAYTGLIKCGECGGTISATFKQKLNKSTGKLKDYFLYYCFCSRKKRNNCTQAKYTNSDILDTAILKNLSYFTITPVFRDWALEILDRQKAGESIAEKMSSNSKESVLGGLKKQLETLTQLRLKEMINDEEFLTEKVRLNNEIVKLEAITPERGVEISDTLELTKEAFNFCVYAHDFFQKGATHEKRQVLHTLIGLNCTLKDKILSIGKPDWLIAIKNGYDYFMQKFNGLELEKFLENKGEIDQNSPYFSELCGLVDDVRTKITAKETSFIIPKTTQKNYVLHHISK